MANNYNSNPIRIDTVMASGWRALQTLNTGSVPGYTFAQQPGFICTKIIWTGIVTAGNTFQIQDPNDATLILCQGQAGSTLVDQVYDFVNGKAFRDFKVTTLASGTLQIYYR